MNYAIRILRAVLLLPFPVLIVIPVGILLCTKFQPLNWSDWQIYLVIILLVLGLSLAVWTMRLFAKIGKGTPAPWDPPTKLVITGPYCYMRNPMLTGVWLLLTAEAIYFQSLGIFLWLVIFIIMNLVYFPLFEEPNLRRRFGKDYENYCHHVPRYFPRVIGWRQSK